VTYGSGAVLGVLCQDNVGIAGLQLNAHTFGVTSEETVQFSSDTVAFDGLMGLAQSVSRLVDTINHSPTFFFRHFPMKASRLLSMLWRPMVSSLQL
jgi:hypothetical protein